MATAASVTADLATCPICLNICDNPKSLPCLHAFCLNCLQENFRDKSPNDRASCPTCRKEFQIPSNGVEGLQHHFLVQRLSDVTRQGGDSCDKHPHKQVELYCCTCKKNICMLCSATVHKYHNSSEIPDMAEGFKLTIDDDDQQLIATINTVREQSEKSLHDAAELHSTIDDIKKHVLANGDEVKCSVDDQINDMLMKLESLTAESVKQSESVQETYQQALVSLESFHTHLRELLDKGRPSDITRAGCELHDRAKELLDNDVTAVKYRPPHVTFTPADVTQVKRPDLIGELTTTTEEQPGEDVLGLSAPDVEIEEENDGQQLQQASDRVAVLQHELIQAADRERQLQMQLDKTKDDISQLQKWLEHRPNLRKQFDVFKLEQAMKQCDMGRVIQTLPEGKPVLGVTSLDNLLYVLRAKSSEHIEVYDIDTYRLLRCLTVPELGATNDIVACKHNRCAYISDSSRESVRRVALPDGGTVTQWPVIDDPAGLSLTYTHGVLVTCDVVRKIKELSTDGQLLHVLTLPQDVVSPFHTIQMSSGQYIVCHGNPRDPLQRVCLVDSDGSVVKSFGGPPGSGSQQMNVPIHMAVDRNEFVFVADPNNRRVLLLSSLLTYVRDVVTREQLRWRPLKVHLDSDRGRLYVADNEWKDGRFTAGRVVVVSV